MKSNPLSKVSGLWTSNESGIKFLRHIIDIHIMRKLKNNIPERKENELP